MKTPPEHTALPERLAMVLKTDRAKDNLPVKIAIGAILILLVSLMFPRPESIEYDYQLGAIWADKDLIAPFPFSILKDAQQYEKERQEVARSVYTVFDRREEVAHSDEESVSAIIRNLREAAALRGRLLKGRSPRDSVRLERLASEIPFTLTETEWREVNQWASPGKKKGAQEGAETESLVSKAITDLLRAGVLDQAKVSRGKGFVSVRKGNTEDIVPFDRVYDLGEAVNSVAEQAEKVTGSKTAASIAAKIARASLRPNLIFTQAETAREIQAAEENVPRSIGFVQENERIIGRHDRITEENKLKLDSFQKARVERGAELSDWKHTVGIVFHVSLVLGLYGIYLFLFRKRIYHDNAKLTLVALLLLMETFFAYVTTSVNLPEPVDYLIFVPAASMLLTIIFDSRVAFYGTVVMALLIGGIKGNEYGIMLTSLIAGALGAYTVRDIRNRTQIFRSLMFIFIGYSLSIITLSFERNESLNTILTSMTYAMANSIFSPVLTYGLLIFFERVFKITTDLTLLELSDFNQPLLRRLAETAPGTFHHSMLLGNLSEAAAEAVGANSILARVGAYYHDIGKMVKPEYFVENQVGPLSRHTRLKPRMSARIIASHVKEGVDLGRQYGLPEKIIDFIPQHHGTTIISYFFDKALNQAVRKNAKEGVDEADFRYPGPKPQTKEAGIVMLADSVEASTRALGEITPQSLEAAIQIMIRQRFSEGQLDYCDLTLRDLTKIKDAFLKILLGIHHQRIQYPEQRREEEEGAGRELLTDGQAVNAADTHAEAQGEQPADTPPAVPPAPEPEKSHETASRGGRHAAGHSHPPPPEGVANQAPHRTGSE